MKRLIIATGNAGKVREIQAILKEEYDEICSMKELGILVEVEEDGKTFAENAKKKAETISRLVKGDVLADDSGLCVAGLNGAPGVYSARFSKEGTDAANNAKLMAAMAGFSEAQRQAKFVCAIALAQNGETQLCVQGECHGEILNAPRGTGGFGYDPLFYLPEYGKTFGQLPAQEKNKISHRSKALQALKEALHENA